MNPMNHDGRTDSPWIEAAESVDVDDTTTPFAPVSAAALHMPTGFQPVRRPWLLRWIGDGR